MPRSSSRVPFICLSASCGDSRASPWTVSCMRMVALRWHCNSVYPILILALGLCALRCTEGCWGKTAPNFGDMTGDYDLLVGSDLVLNCTLNSHFIQIDSQKNHTYFVNSSNLVFKRGSRISSDLVHRLDALTAQLKIINATQEDSGIYHCKVTVPGIPGVPVVCSSKVSVGYPPKPVKNFGCISRNFENLTCSWDIESSGVQTKYFLYKNHFLSTYFQNPSLQLCPEETSNSTYCQWRDDTDPPYQTSGQMLTFVVQGNNSLGSSSDTYVVNHYEIVIPKSPVMLTVVQVGKQSVLLHWRPPKRISQMKVKPALQYEMWIQELVTNSTEKRVIDVGNDTSSYTVTGLIPYMLYNISLRCRSNYTSKDNMWSLPVSVRARSKADVPYLVPDIIPEAFELHYYDDYRTATLYWKPVPATNFNGEAFQYHVVCFPNASAENSTAPLRTKNTTATFIKFENLQKNSTYFFHIYSSNKAGLSKDFKVISVNNQENIPPGPKGVTVISHDPGHYELSWTPPSTPNVTSYTVLWCSSLKPWRSRCDGPIQWLKSNSTHNNFSLTLTDFSTNYQFAVVSNTAKSSSGMQWSTCIVPYKAPLGKIDYVIVEQKNSTSLKIIWRLNCAAQKAVVKNFEIVYCKLNIEEVCKEKESIIVDEPSAESYLLHNLHPYSNYSIVLRAFNHAGNASENSDMRFQSTLQGAPSDAPRDIRVIPKPNASLQINWQPPLVPNGIITHYNLYYNDIKETVKVDSELQNSYEIEIHRLQHYTNYHIKLEACVLRDCSPMSDEVIARTDVGVPTLMDPPRVEAINDTHFKISWTAPSQPNGPIDFYDVQWRRRIGTNDTSPHTNMQQKTVPSGLFAIVELKCTELEDSGIPFLFFIRAANRKNGETLFGMFSESTKTQACIKSQGLAMIIGVAIGGTLALAVFLLFICKFIKWMSDKIHQVKSITVRLPKGLEGPETNPLKNYENFKNGLSQQAAPVVGIERLSYVIDDADNKNRHGSGSSQFSNSSADELIYKNGKCTKFARKPSGESSGCSSMSSNATTRVHLSSDSGTESDFAVPPSPEVFMEQNTYGNHKPALPILMEVQGQEAAIEAEKNSYADKQMNNHTNFMNGMVYKVDQPYSKFGIAGNPNSSTPGRGVNPLVFYSSNLANSEPSVFDADFSSTRGQTYFAPYSKIGLAKSTTDLLGIPAIAREMGYSKFGLSSRPDDHPSNYDGTPTVQAVMVNTPPIGSLKEWNDIRSFLKGNKLDKQNLKMPQDKVVGERSIGTPYMTHKHDPSAGLEHDVDSGYIKFGLSKNIGKYASPGYISLNEAQNLKSETSPDAGPVSSSTEEFSTPNYLVPVWAKSTDRQTNILNVAQLRPLEIIPKTENLTGFNSLNGAGIGQGDYPRIEPASPSVTPHSSDIRTICGDSRNNVPFSHLKNNWSESSNCSEPARASSMHLVLPQQESGAMNQCSRPMQESVAINQSSHPLQESVTMNQASQPMQESVAMNQTSRPMQESLAMNQSSLGKRDIIPPIPQSLSSTNKKNGYVPLSHLSNPMPERTSSHVPIVTGHFQTPQGGGDLDFGTLPNVGILINGVDEGKHSRCSDVPVIHTCDHALSLKTDAPGKLHLQNGVNYMNGSLNYILKSLPKVESEICEV